MGLLIYSELAMDITKISTTHAISYILGRKSVHLGGLLYVPVIWMHDSSLDDMLEFQRFVCEVAKSQEQHYFL